MRKNEDVIAHVTHRSASPVSELFLWIAAENEYKRSDDAKRVTAAATEGLGKASETTNTEKMRCLKTLDLTISILSEH